MVCTYVLHTTQMYRKIFLGGEYGVEVVVLKGVMLLLFILQLNRIKAHVNIGLHIDFF